MPLCTLASPRPPLTCTLPITLAFDATEFADFSPLIQYPNPLTPGLTHPHTSHQPLWS